MSFTPFKGFEYRSSFKDRQEISKIDIEGKKATGPSLDRKRPKPDAKYDPHSPEYVRETAKTKSKTNCVQKLTQGVSTKGRKPSGLRVLPVAGTGLDDNEIAVLNLGQPSTFKKNEAFEDIASLTKSEIKSNKTVDSSVVDFVKDSNGQTYSLDLVNKSYDNPSQYDGIIEPFAIRAAISNTSTESQFNAKSVRGSLQDGNLDSFRRSNFIQNLYQLNTSSEVVAFLDGNDKMGNINLIDSVWDVVRTIQPFDETQNNDNNINVEALLLSASSDMINAIENLSPSSEQYPPAGFKSARTGFIFTNGGLGVDSIAFGGLTNNA